MELDIAGKVALVTGASIGIGAGIARILANEGVRLAITARRELLLEGLADELEAAGHARPLVIVHDITAEDAPQVIANRVLGEFGRLDILINNAGGSTPMPPDASDEEWGRSFALNFDAARRLTNVFMTHMRGNGWGRIINISGAMEPGGTNAGQAGSATTHAWAKGLSRDLAKDGITVNCIPPGRINSEQILERLHPDPKARAQFIEDNIPVGYFGDPEDVGHLVAFLCSPLARYITGSVIYVDGGMHRFVH
jgi:3-oxoacyl-[acyl-carrier protein] reductase